MDAYSVYLNTFRYVMNADPSVKSSWCDIFKYLPCLRRILSCSVCGNILQNPHGPSSGVCLHNVCYKCIGGKTLIKSSCSCCKNSTTFEEKKKLRVLVLCFKRLCAYISNSHLGSVIFASSVNGHDNERESTQKALRDAEQFEDEYELTPPPSEPLRVLKQKVKEHKYNFSEYKPSTSGFARKQRDTLLPQVSNATPRKQKQGCKKSISAINLKSSPKSNASIHVKRLKRKALTTSRRKSAVTQRRIHQKRVVPVTSGGLLISQRPHRELSGKFSVGQLWRETFLEERSPEPEVYPDSGIEVGNLSDQDHCSQSPTSTSTEKGKEDKVGSSTSPATVKVPFPVRDTRLHPVLESKEDTTVSKVKSAKPKLSLKIPKSRLHTIQRKYSPRASYFKKKEDAVSLPASRLTTKRPISKIPQIRGRTINTRVKRKNDICCCARFKRPNQLTCFGQKCPCYRDRKACVNCLCNGCKNPRHHSDSAPPLMQMSKVKDTQGQCLSPDVDMSMPRLSPIPRM